MRRRPPRDGKRCDILREMLLEESDAQDDADNRVHDDQQWLTLEAATCNAAWTAAFRRVHLQPRLDGPARQHAHESVLIERGSGALDERGSSPHVPARSEERCTTKPGSRAGPGGQDGRRTTEHANADAHACDEGVGLHLCSPCDEHADANAREHCRSPGNGRMTDGSTLAN